MFIQNLLQQESFAKLLGNHAIDIIAHLMDEHIEFGVLCNLSEVEFEPTLPADIYSTLKPLTLFMVAGFTFESAKIRDDLVLEFEAGFGRENFGSVVQVPITSILQIMVGDTVVFVNLTATLPNKRSQKKEESSTTSIESSMSGFLNNPENQKFNK
jgi:hypothetical protein